jgi:hypothetical protein
MNASVLTLRLVAGLAAVTGYAVAIARARLRLARALLTSAANWRELEAGVVRLRVPNDWGELEREADGTLILHNRPRRFRIDGDAVWYSSAIELRIFRGEGIAPRNAEAMTATRRIVALTEGAATIELAVANGVGARQRALAERVLWSAEPVVERRTGAPRTMELTGT